MDYVLECLLAESMLSWQWSSFQSLMALKYVTAFWTGQTWSVRQPFGRDGVGV